MFFFTINVRSPSLFWFNFFKTVLVLILLIFNVLINLHRAVNPLFFAIWDLNHSIWIFIEFLVHLAVNFLLIYEMLHSFLNSLFILNRRVMKLNLFGISRKYFHILLESLQNSIVFKMCIQPVLIEDRLFSFHRYFLNWNSFKFIDTWKICLRQSYLLM